MRVLFVYTEINVKFGTYGFQHGIAAISAYLKSYGYDGISFCYIRSCYDIGLFRKALLRFKPDIVGFYVTDEQLRFIEELILEVKEKEIFTICGGPYAILNPRIIYKIPRLDAVCIGEGESPMLEFVKVIEKNENPKYINGLWIRNGREIIENPAQPFLDKLDELPFCDRELFANSKLRDRVGLTQISY